MRLTELFSDDPIDMTDGIKQDLLDVLTPLLAHKVPFVTVKQVMDKIRAIRPGITVDRDFIFTILNPDETPAVKKIEDDKIYLAPLADDAAREVAEKDREREKERFKAKAAKQARKEMSKN